MQKNRNIHSHRLLTAFWVTGLIVLSSSANAGGRRHRGDGHHRSPRPVKGTVLDMCTLPLQEAGKGYAKQRVVIFDLGGEEITNRPEGEINRKGERIEGRKHYVMRRIGAHNHIRNAFFSAFPLERHHVVAASVVPPASLARQTAVSDVDMIRAASLDSFAAYSIACADWVVVPRIVKKKADWHQIKKKKRQEKKEIEYWAWSLQLKLDIEVTAFKFDDGQWVSMGTERSTSTQVDIALPIIQAGEGANEVAKAVSGKETMETYFSAMPEPTCKVPLVDDFRAIADGFSSCGAQTMVFTDQLMQTVHTDRRNRKQAEEATRLAAEAEKEKDAATADGEESEFTENAADGNTDPTASESEDDGADDNTSTAAASDDSEAEAGNTDNIEADTPAPIPPAPNPMMDDTLRDATFTAMHGSPLDGARKILEYSAISAGNTAVPGMESTMASAQQTVDTCKVGVENVVQLKDKLRSIGSSPVGMARDAVLGFAACAGIPLSYNLGNATPPGVAQQKSRYCRKVKDEVSMGERAMRSVAVCQSRVSMEHTAITSQRDAVNAWWQIKVPLLRCKDDVKSRTFCIAAGKAEGVRRGHVFEVMRNNKRVGFGMVTHTGSGGGARGEMDPSLFRFRGGRGQVDDAVVERAKIGLELGVKPLYNYFVMSKNLTSSTMYGGAVEAGYNAGRFVEVGDEFWVRSHGGFLMGQDDEMMVNIAFLPEAQYYLVRRVAAFVQIGAAIDFVMKKIADEDYSGMSVGGVFGLGFDIALHPDLYFRMGAYYNQGVIETELKKKKEDDSDDETDATAEKDAETDTVNLGRLGTLTGSASINYHF